MHLSQASKCGFNGRIAILRHIALTGRTIAGYPVWTVEEFDALRGLYPDRQAIALALVRRSKVAIQHKARSLGLITPRRIWSEQEVELLRTLYRTPVTTAGLVEGFPGRTKQQIWRKAGRLRIRRPRRPLRMTGLPFVDSVRQYAFAQGHSMTDMDAWTGAKGYFRSPRYCNWRALTRAVELLGCEPTVSWRHDRADLDHLSPQTSRS
ncbi:hypothetical protein [Bosea sp. LC85]|uniref:hypothetical protein n=1 Tax=Bosea sp. LC85 TaxID=1502851 RepID=UPI0005BC7B96|nr:hypothetical protein [Bosea sp. LC85]